MVLVTFAETKVTRRTGAGARIKIKLYRRYTNKQKRPEGNNPTGLSI